MVLFFAASNLARRFGRAKEQDIFAYTGGRPRNPELTHADSTFPASQKGRYRDYLAAQLGLAALTAEDERSPFEPFATTIGFAASGPMRPCASQCY